VFHDGGGGDVKRQVVYVNLHMPAMFGGVELTPGEYKVEVNDQKAVIRNGKIHGETAVKVENGDTKYGTTTVRMEKAGDKMKIQEIRIGGTTMKLVVECKKTYRAKY